MRVAHSPTAEQKQKKRTSDVLPKPDNLIRYRQACSPNVRLNLAQRLARAAWAQPRSLKSAFVVRRAMVSRRSGLAVFPEDRVTSKRSVDGAFGPSWGNVAKGRTVTEPT